jgi:hypothetical protein
MPSSQSSLSGPSQAVPYQASAEPSGVMALQSLSSPSQISAVGVLPPWHCITPLMHCMVPSLHGPHAGPAGASSSVVPSQSLSLPSQSSQLAASGQSGSTLPWHGP